MSRNIQTLAKWLPLEIRDQNELFLACKELKLSCENLQKRIIVLLDSLKSKQCSKFYYSVTENELQTNDMEDVSSTMENMVNDFNTIFHNLNNVKKMPVVVDKINMWKDILWKTKLKISYFVQELINEMAFLFVYYGERVLVLTLKISSSYNSLLAIDKKLNIRGNASICNNTCPYLMFPLRRVSVTRILQILAGNRAELCCHKLIDCLLECYKLYDANDDDNSSDNSSVEIYRALTKHMSPPADVLAGGSEIDQKCITDVDDSGSFLNMEELLAYEEKNVLDLLEMTLKAAPAMLGNDGVKKSRSTGSSKISTKAQKKVLGYYEQILWGEVGNYLEHVVLWWAASPLAARPPHSSQHLREWINQFTPTADVPSAILSALSSLADALGVHVTSTSWDRHFRLALVASRTACNPETGRLFCDVLQDLVTLSNQCEVTTEWIVGAPLAELPLVEQIPVLHRLDHSIHTTRLWAINESKYMANLWNVDGFFKVTHTDIVNYLSQLNGLRLTDHSIEIEKGGLDVHVEVCALMRAKLVSEVNVNVQKLKDAPKECVDGLAAVCRTISLANLQMIFPPPSHWKQPGSEIPANPSPYVDKYLNQILSPVLAATEDHVIANMILKLICESWLDHIYINKIKFTRNGACQLLCDFGYVTTWLLNCSIISQTMRKKMVKNEILRRCEGVGRLLLRCPGEHIKMMDKNKRRISVAPESPSSEPKAELMPAEMYVPNQEQWLELRAAKHRSMFSTTLCCGKF